MTPVLLPGNMGDARLWTGAVRAALPGAIDADVASDATIAAMATRALAAVGGPLLPVEELKPTYLAAARRGDRALLALLRDMGTALGPDVFVRQSEALRTRADLTPTLAALDAPVALVVGAEDALCPPAWYERWRRLARRATLAVVPGCGHMVPLEAPDAVIAAVRSIADERKPA